MKFIDKVVTPIVRVPTTHLPQQDYQECCLIFLLNFYLKVHPNIELEGLVVQMLDASGHAADGDAKLVADEGGGGAISVRGLHQAQLELSLQPRLK